MAVLHFHQSHTNHRRAAERLRCRAARSRGNRRDSFGLGPGLVLTGIGLVLLAGFAGTALTDAAPIGALLIVLGCPFLVFGGLLLVIGGVEAAWRRLRRVQHHCGRCRFYRALEGQYALGRCRIDPRQAVVRRTDACAFFAFSERAWVRDRFTQRAESLARARKQESKQQVAQ